MTGGQRGQTTIDFAIGVSLFLLVVVFVFLFVPDLLDPFNSGTQEETVAVNRVADELSQRQLGTASDLYVLNATCTVRFFDNASAPNCGFDDKQPFDDQMNIDARQRINVTFTRLDGTNVSDPDNVLCWDDSKDAVTTKTGSCNTGSGDVVFRRGESLPVGSSSSVSARRVVTLDGRAVSMTVVMW